MSSSLHTRAGQVGEGGFLFILCSTNLCDPQPRVPGAWPFSDSSPPTAVASLGATARYAVRVSRTRVRAEPSRRKSASVRAGRDTWRVVPLLQKMGTMYRPTSTFSSGLPWKPLHYHPGSPDRTPRHEAQTDGWDEGNPARLVPTCRKANTFVCE